MNDWINKDVVIDFPLLPNIQDIAEHCEEYAATDNWAYFEWADTIDVACKNAYAVGKMTKKQWDIVVERYRC